MFKTCTVLFVLIVVGNCMPYTRDPPVDPCLSNPCLSSDFFTYQCICPENYANNGTECVYDPCYGNPCGDFGTCYNNDKQRRCECVDGYRGEPCVPIPQNP